ncbi:hypothetical protein [Olsenella sp. An293]|uniref:hypothetical protein n=1 Tax=Olsenella sp. An293 TaxID=1965626 RepID=UPI000B396E08|nr:hypothetical protein [Olsenella sp. An293]OUO33633.1 hypothetical protein B5F85_01925 [Olsenella sp. An293]
MDDYNLEPGEFVIMQEASVKLDDDTTLDELVLTNQNLVLVTTMSQELLRRSKFVKRCPLSRIRGSQEEPQALVTKYRESYYLQVVYPDETISVTFPSNTKRSAERWAEAIRNAAVGNLSSIQPEDTLPPEIADFVDGAKGAFGAIFGGGKKPADKNGASQRPSSVTKRCMGCHAPITGRAGSTVICPYCDTKQTI